MGFKKIMGWILLLAGLAVISWSLYSSYNIFTGKARAPQVFKLEEGTLNSVQETKMNLDTVDFQEQIQEMIRGQMKDIVPSEILYQLLNLISWSIFVGILIFGSSRLSGIGIKLMRGE